MQVFIGLKFLDLNDYEKFRVKFKLLMSLRVIHPIKEYLSVSIKLD